MRLGILATNVLSGGGVAHVSEILRHLEKEEHGVQSVTVWCGRTLAERLPERSWLKVDQRPVFDRPLPFRILWELTAFERIAGAACDLLFVPGATYWGGFRPYVAMAQNLLPFSPVELRRFGLTPSAAKFRLLRLAQQRCMKRAAGVVFPTDHCRSVIVEALGGLDSECVVVHHGLDDRFRCPPREQRPITDHSRHSPFRVLYVSTINAYKHQELAVQAVKTLRDKGLPVALDLVGGGRGASLHRLKRTLRRLDPDQEFVQYHGKQPFDQLHRTYRESDCFLLASTCESLGIVLLEAMASGLPIVCSDLRPMSDLLAGSGELFRPADPVAMAAALERLIRDVGLRKERAAAAYQRAQHFSWVQASRETFEFLARVGARDSGQ